MDVEPDPEHENGAHHDRRELTPVPQCDAVNRVAFSVQLMAENRIRVVIYYEDEIACVGEIDDEPAMRRAIVHAFVRMRPQLRSHADRLVDMLSVRCGVERVYSAVRVVDQRGRP
ncbi:MAG: hypothetical protein IT458_20850 [Planctomycetes bacterium]|nr:hypothetical protein [Planctomycetota bacterium]